MVTPKFSFISTCVGRLHHLGQTLPTWLSQPNSEVIVTTSRDCPQRTRLWVQKWFPQVRCLELEHPFNFSLYRGAAALVSQGEWLVSIDADIGVSPTFAQDLEKVIQPGNFYGSSTLEGSCGFGTLVVRRDEYNSTGGFDPRLTEGYGADELHLWKTLCAKGVRHKLLPPLNRYHIDHGDDQRTKSFSEKAKWKSHNANWAISEKICSSESVKDRWREHENSVSEQFNAVWRKASKIRGFVKENEMRFLYECLARTPLDAKFLETGAFGGLSTYAQGSTGRQIITMDPLVIGRYHKKFDITQDQVDSLKRVTTDLPNVRWVRDSITSTPLAGKFDGIFIDGDRDYPAPMIDLLTARCHLRRGATVCVHDYTDVTLPGVKQAVDEAVRSGIIKHCLTVESMWCGYLLSTTAP